MRKITLEDTFKMARLIKEGNLTQHIKAAYMAGKQDGANVEEIGMNAIMDILLSCSTGKVEVQVYDLLAGICEKKPEDVKKQSLETTVSDIKKICEENNIINFFKSASRLSSAISN